MIAKDLPCEREQNFEYIPQAEGATFHTTSPFRTEAELFLQNFGFGPGLIHIFFAKKKSGSDPDQTQNFGEKSRTLYEVGKLFENSRPREIYSRFYSLAHGKTYTIIFEVVLRKKF